MSKVVTFGELMLRFAPQGHLRFLQSDSFGVTFGGAEANVSVSLAGYGAETAFVTKLPTHEIGQLAVNSLRQVGVDTSEIVRGGKRVGVYYVEKGASQRPSKVIYDRENSAIAEALPEEFNWDDIFADADWFHFSGITPALSDNLAKACREACIAAKKRGMTVSCDTNFRSKLWTAEKAREVMGGLMPYVDVCVSNAGDAKDVFGLLAGESFIPFDEMKPEDYEALTHKMVDRYGFKKVGLTIRKSISADDNDWAGMFFDGKTFAFSKQYRMHIVDRVGGGDCFTAGLIYAMRENYSPEDTVEFAVAASCLKHAIEGDYAYLSAEEVWNLAKGSGNGRIQR